jgi:carbamate kinase
MDGRRNNKGTKGNKGGRPPKADEIKFLERLDNIIDKDMALSKLEKLIKEDNFHAIKLYLEYRFGKPKETVDNNITFVEGFNLKELYAKDREA